MIKEMMATYNRGRGGYRKPKAKTSNAVSGPGALSQRTDGNPTAPVVAAGGDYGSRKQMEDQVSSGGPLAKVAPNISAPNVFAPTENPTEPITAGVPTGAGEMPMVMSDNTDLILQALYQTNPSPIILELINNRNI
jgi:hypothetical protein